MTSFSKVANALKKALNTNQSPTESEVENASKLFQKLSSKEFVHEFEKNLHTMEIDSNIEMIEKTVNIITRQVKQMKMKSGMKSISLEMESYEYPFPPTVIITTGREEIVLETDKVKPKELHYEYEALSADYNVTNENNRKVILETYKNITNELKQYDWKGICKTADQLEVTLVKPQEVKGDV